MRETALIAACLAISHGCAPVPQSRVARNPEIVIDLESGTAVAPDWRSSLKDCSDAEFQCVEAPGHFLMAFPRTCPGKVWDWQVAGYRFRLTAPAAHYGLPGGGYYS